VCSSLWLSAHYSFALLPIPVVTSQMQCGRKWAVYSIDGSAGDGDLEIAWGWTDTDRKDAFCSFLVMSRTHSFRSSTFYLPTWTLLSHSERHSTSVFVLLLLSWGLCDALLKAPAFRRDRPRTGTSYAVQAPMRAAPAVSRHEKMFISWKLGCLLREIRHRSTRSRS
jgi:hypothetical protein